MPKTPKQVIKAWVAAFNDHNAETASELYYEEAENLQVAIGQVLKGKAAIKDDLKAFFKSVPDSHTHIVNIFEDGEWAVLEWSGTGTFYASPHTEGKPFTLSGCGFFHVVDGKIWFQRGYWDKYTWFKQIGLPLA